MLPVIAKDAGMDDGSRDASDTIATIRLPDRSMSSLSEKWLGGNAQTFMKGVADVFVEARVDRRRAGQL